MPLTFNKEQVYHALVGMGYSPSEGSFNRFYHDLKMLVKHREEMRAERRRLESSADDDATHTHSGSQGRDLNSGTQTRKRLDLDRLPSRTLAVADISASRAAQVNNHAFDTDMTSSEDENYGGRAINPPGHDNLPVGMGPRDSVSAPSVLTWAANIRPPSVYVPTDDENDFKLQEYETGTDARDAVHEIVPRPDSRRLKSVMKKMGSDPPRPSSDLSTEDVRKKKHRKNKRQDSSPESEVNRGSGRGQGQCPGHGQAPDRGHVKINDGDRKGGLDSLDWKQYSSKTMACMLDDLFKKARGEIDENLITPRVRPATATGATRRKDPVSLYHQYQKGWNKQPPPGENPRAELRWCVRAKTIGIIPSVNGKPVDYLGPRVRRLM